MLWCGRGLSQAARVQRWWLNSVLAVIGITATYSSMADAAPGEDAVRIRYNAPATCPDVAYFTAQLRERTERARLAEANELARTFEIDVISADQGYSGQVEFLDDAGAKVNRRVQGEQCDAVVSSLALITALALDATVHEQDSEPAPVAPPPPTPEPIPAAPPRAERAPAKHRALRAVRAGLQVGYGSATSAPRLGLLGEIEFRSGLSLRLTAHYAWHELDVDAGRSANLRLLGFETGVCPLRFDWGVVGVTPCAALDLGALRAAGVPSAELTSSSDETIGWASVGGQLALAFRPVPPFWLELRGAVEFPLRAGYRFTFKNPDQTAYEVPYVSGWAGISAGVRFW